MSIKYINNNDKVIDNPYLAELDNVIHPVGIVMPWIKHIVPEEVCKGMVDMLDSTGWFIKNIDKSPQEYIDSHRVLDICCRSGNFLRAFYERFNVYLSYKIKNQDKRDYFIWRYLLFGFAGQIREELSKGLTADQENKVADAAIKELRKELYSGFCFYEEDFHGNIYDIQFRPYLDGNNLVWTGKDCPGYTTTFENRAFGKELNEMKFNAIIGNPPYNNDAYIDFVTKGHAIATDYSLWITPAKWQAKSGQKNEAFRQNIVPHMKKIVYYPDCGDVFDIRLQGGVAYYLCNKKVHDIKQIKQSCSRIRQFNGTSNRQFNQDVFLDTDICYNICKKVGCFDKGFRYFIPKWTAIKDNINIFITAINTDAGGKTSFHVYSNNGNLTMLAPFNRSKEDFYRSNDTKCIFSAHDDREADSFESWCGSKFVRFMLLMRYCSYHNNNDYSWKFVPDPGAFDHIFTDEELYKKYNLTEEEINIIESVIKERK